MNYLYNKEFRIGAIILMIVSAIFAFFVFQQHQVAAYILVVNDFVLVMLFFFFTTSRYRKIQRMSQYLQDIYEGRDTFDIRDYEEGELSVLKSDIYKITQILQQQKDILLKDRSFLADSLSNISHQLKTPLTSMLVMCDLLKDEELPKEKQDQFLLQMRKALERTEWLVTTLLKLSKIDANTIPFDKKEYNVLEVLQESVEPLLIPMELKQQQFHIEGAEHMKFFVDKNWTKEAISNIVKNCMEHTPMEGTLFIQALDNPLYILIEIKNNGKGIAKEDVPHIFERFYRGKNASTDSVGIGLSLSNAIFHHQNAQIDVESEEGSGTTFTIRFYK